MCQQKMHPKNRLPFQRQILLQRLPPASPPPPQSRQPIPPRNSQNHSPNRRIPDNTLQTPRPPRIRPCHHQRTPPRNQKRRQSPSPHRTPGQRLPRTQHSPARHQPPTNTQTTQKTDRQQAPLSHHQLPTRPIHPVRHQTPPTPYHSPALNPLSQSTLQTNHQQPIKPASLKVPIRRGALGTLCK